MAAKQSRKSLSQEVIDDIKKDASQITSGDSNLTGIYERYEEVYFMTGGETGKDSSIDPNDWKKTVSPTGRNAVTGMKRLLDTSEIHVNVKAKGDKIDKSDEIEKALKHILQVSGMFRRARVEKDLNLSAVLYGPTILAAESVQDLITVQKNKALVARLQRILASTPFLLRAVTPKQSFSKWGEFGMLAHLRKYEVTGDIAMERWGLPDLSKSNKYTIQDWIDLENRLVWMDGVAEPLLAKPHGLSTLNIAARFAGGSSLFDESDKQMQSFLYAHTKGEWDKRENLFWTYLFTALFRSGLPGPLLIVDPDSVAGTEQKLEVDFTGGVRKIFAKANLADYPVVDGDVLQIKNLMDAVNSESTIYRQTLGENIESSTFSGLAMLSSAGQLPLEDPKEAIAFTFRDIFEHIITRCKEEGIALSPTINGNDIPDDFEIEVTLEPKLPQDNLRNAQVAYNLGPLVSDEWKRSELLQISDNKAMTKQVAKETLFATMLKAMGTDQNLIMSMINAALGQVQQPAQINAGPNGPASPGTAMPAQADSQRAMQGASIAGQPGNVAQPMTEQLPIGG